MKFEEIAIKKVFKNEENLCTQGLEVKNLIKIVKGRCKTMRFESNGNMILLSYYEGSGFIGDVEYFSEDSEAFTTIVAVGEVTAYIFPLKKTKEYFKNDLAFTQELAKSLDKKFKESALQNSENILLSVEERLLSYLQFSFPKGRVNAKLCDLAMLLGTSYRQLLRCVKVLVQKGYLEKKSNGYYLIK